MGWRRVGVLGRWMGVVGLALGMAVASLAGVFPAGADQVSGDDPLVGPAYLRTELFSVGGLPTDEARAGFTPGGRLLVLQAFKGVTAEVAGYDGEPYLRLDADGTAWVNRNSVSAYLNEDYYARGEIPPEILQQRPGWLEPAWEPFAYDRTLAWHDHRAHWNTVELPAEVNADGTIRPWTIPVVVNGAPYELTGRSYFDFERAAAAGIDTNVIAVGASTNVVLLAAAVTLIVVSVAVIVVLVVRRRRRPGDPESSAFALSDGGPLATYVVSPHGDR